MKVWTVSIFDGRSDPLLAVFSTEEKANKYRAELVASQLPMEWIGKNIWTEQTLLQARINYRRDIAIYHWEVDEESK